MSSEPSNPALPALAAALTYDELPEGSELRREYDGRGGVTLTAPAGELPPSVRRAVARAGLVPASVAFGLCVIAVGLFLLNAARTNRLDPALRLAAILTLGVLGGGIFLFVWVTHYAMLAYAMLEARREATVLHADGRRILVETSGRAGGRSVEVAAGQVRAIEVVSAAYDPTRRSAPVPCLRLLLRDGSSHLLLGGHHIGELEWVATTVSEATGVPIKPPAMKGGGLSR